MASRGTLRRPVILVVDDEPDIALIARICLEHEGWEVHTADCFADAVDIASRLPLDAILSDILLRGGSGTDLVRWARGALPDSLLIVVLTGCMDEKTDLIKSAGADIVYFKPCRWSDLIAHLHHGVRTRMAKGEGKQAPPFDEATMTGGFRRHQGRALPEVKA